MSQKPTPSFGWTARQNRFGMPSVAAVAHLIRSARRIMLIIVIATLMLSETHRGVDELLDAAGIEGGV